MVLRDVASAWPVALNARGNNFALVVEPPSSDSNDLNPRDPREILVLSVEGETVGHSGGSDPAIHYPRPPALASSLSDQFGEGAGYPRVDGQRIEGSH